MILTSVVKLKGELGKEQESYLEFISGEWREGEGENNLIIQRN